MEKRLTQLTEHIWLLPHDPDPDAVQSSIGVIATHNESVLIDAGNSPLYIEGHDKPFTQVELLKFLQEIS